MFSLEFVITIFIFELEELSLSPKTSISVVISSPTFNSITFPDISLAKNLPSNDSIFPIIADIKTPNYIYKQEYI